MTPEEEEVLVRRYCEVMSPTLSISKDQAYKQVQQLMSILSKSGDHDQARIISTLNVFSALQYNWSLNAQKQIDNLTEQVAQLTIKMNTLTGGKPE